MRFVNKALRQVFGDATVDLGGGYYIKLNDTTKVGLDTLVDHWQVYKGEEKIGNVGVFRKKAHNPTLETISIFQPHQKKGIGTKVHKALIQNYGVLESATSESTDNIRSIWKSLNATIVPKKDMRGKERYQKKHI